MRISRLLAIHLATVFVLLSASPAPAARDFWSVAVPGSYEGQLYSDGVFYPVVTTLHVLHDELIGGYTLYEPGETAVTGTLDGFQATGPHSCSFVWHDKYGSGPLSLVFSDDGRSFQGEWASQQHPGRSFPWDGFKLNGPEPKATSPNTK